MYASPNPSLAEKSRQCEVSLTGFTRYINAFRRHLVLERNGIRCSPKEALDLRMKKRRDQRLEIRVKYGKAIATCDSMDYIEYNVFQIAREFGLSGTDFGRQLRTRYPEILESHERIRQRLDLGDGLPRGTRPWCKEQYAGVVELLRADSYITMREVARRFNVSFTGLKQHLMFCHQDLLEKRTKICEQAVGRKRKGEITGNGTLHAPAFEKVAKYAEAVHLYRTIPMSARKIALQIGVSVRGFSD